MANNDFQWFNDMLKEHKPKKSVKKWFRDRLDDATDFFDHNKEFCIIVGVPVMMKLIGLGTAGVRAAGRNHVVKTEIRAKERRFYDPSLRCYWQLNHKLSNTEKTMISKRRKNGERLADILNDMNLL